MSQNAPFLIALVDDDVDDKEIFEEALEEVSPKTRIKTFDNGQNFLDYVTDAEIELPMITFLDINMPIKNGFETLSELRESARLKKLCVIMYSTSDSRADVKKSYLLGANGFVQKPSSHTALNDMLSKIVATDWNNASAALEQHNFVLTAE